MGNPDAIRVVSWDVDGTLYSMSDMRRELHRWLWTRLKRQRLATALEIWEFETTRRMLEKHRKQSQGSLDAFLRTSTCQAFLKKQSEWIGHGLQSSGARDGVRRTLASCRRRGFRVVAFSDFPIGPKLEMLGLAEFFEAVFIASDWGYLKPDTRAFHRLSSLLDVPCQQILHIGDRESTDGGARDSGMPCVIIGNEPYEAWKDRVEALL